MAGKVGRPKKKIKVTKEQLKLLAQYGLDLNEIAAVAGVSVSTLGRNFDDIIKEGHSHLKGSLKRKQVEVALSGNCSMLIWLGKQFLNQADKVDTTDKTDYAELMRLASNKMT